MTEVTAHQNMEPSQQQAGPTKKKAVAELKQP
jgi:hypothetical protein